MDQRYVFAIIAFLSIVIMLCVFAYLGINSEVTHALIGLLGMILGILTGVGIDRKVMKTPEKGY